jgi:hypothetical protein
MYCVFFQSQFGDRLISLFAFWSDDAMVTCHVAVFLNLCGTADPFLKVISYILMKQKIG